MALSYFQRDERPAWQPTISVNGAVDDYTSGFTFTVTILDASGTTVLTKTTAITGDTGGLINVDWEPDELDLPAGTYRLQLTVRRTADEHEETISEQLLIRERAA